MFMEMVQQLKSIKIFEPLQTRDALGVVPSGERVGRDAVTTVAQSAAAALTRKNALLEFYLEK